MVVLIPLRIRSISTQIALLQNAMRENGLNPFENQVYFYVVCCFELLCKRPGLNPFENQVYFYNRHKVAKEGTGVRRS